MALRAIEMDEDAGAGKHETGGAGDLVAGVLKQPESVLQGSEFYSIYENALTWRRKFSRG